MDLDVDELLDAALTKTAKSQEDVQPNDQTNGHATDNVTSDKEKSDTTSKEVSDTKGDEDKKKKEKESKKDSKRRSEKKHKKRKRSRSRSRSRSKRRRRRSSRSRDRFHYSSSSSSRRSRSRRPSREITKPKSPSPPPPKEDKVSEIERLSRTVFCMNLTPKASKADIIRFFEKAGVVRDVKLIEDRNSRKSKGLGYVEFVDKNSIPAALQLTGQPLKGVPVMVQPTQAEKNDLTTTTTPSTAGPTRLYVGDLHPLMDEGDLKIIFELFGDVEFANINKNDAGKPTGFGFVQFKDPEDAKKAQMGVDGQKIRNKPLKVSFVQSRELASLSGGLSHHQNNNITTTVGDLDDDAARGGVRLDATRRLMLMNKYGKGASPAPTAASTAANGVNTLANNNNNNNNNNNIPTTGTAITSQVIVPEMPSPCILLKNMFDPAEEEDPNFDKEIEEETEEEVSKFGKVLHIHVDKNSVGYVYIKFDSVKAATEAKNLLHGRWFAGKMITAQFFPIEQYDATFPTVNQ